MSKRNDPRRPRTLTRIRPLRLLATMSEGSKALMAEGPVLADSVEKVLSGVGTNFLRTAGALGVLGRGGPLQPERIQPVAFADALRDIANRIRRSARFCANFVAAIFSTVSTESAQSGRWRNVGFRMKAGPVSLSRGCPLSGEDRKTSAHIESFSV